MEAVAIHRHLGALFNPDTVAVIGASDNPGKLGFHVMKSLTQGGFTGRIVPMNPGAKKIMGIPSVPSIDGFQDPIDLAIVAVPAPLVPGIFEACEKKSVKGIVLISAGFKEIDDPSGAQQQSILERIVRRATIPVIGPNTFGVVNVHRNLNASFTPEFSRLKKGNIALVSQSGGICHLFAFMAMSQNVGMSEIVGLGNRLNVGFPEMITHLMEDPETEVLALYLEGLEDPRDLMETARAFRGRKPIVAYKTGRTRNRDQASISHTGSAAGDHELYEASFRQGRIFGVDSMEALLDAARAFSVCSLPKGPRIAILSGQAGPGISAHDTCEMGGLEIARFQPQTQRAINELLPPIALRTNPVDLGPAWYNSAAIRGILKTVMEDDHVDGILLLMMFASANREALENISSLLLEWKQRKPIITCLISPPGIWDGQVRELEMAGAMINLDTPERAAKCMTYLWQYKKMVN